MRFSPVFESSATTAALPVAFGEHVGEAEAAAAAAADIEAASRDLFEAGFLLRPSITDDDDEEEEEDDNNEDEDEDEEDEDEDEGVPLLSVNKPTTAVWPFCCAISMAVRPLHFTVLSAPLASNTFTLSV